MACNWISQRTGIVLACIYSAAFAAYIYILYSPGLILWQPDFLAFMGETPSRYFPCGYPVLLQSLGGGVIAGRVLSAFGLAVVMCILLAASIKNYKPIPAAMLALLAAITSPSLFSSVLSPSVDMLYTALTLLLLAVCFQFTYRNGSLNRLFTLQLLLIVFLTIVLSQLRYHAPALTLAAAIALLPTLNNRPARYAIGLLAAMSIALFFTSKFSGYTSTLREQIWCGLEFRYHRLAERGVLDGLPRAGDINGYVWDQYGSLKKTAHTSGLLDYYSVQELAKHSAINYYHFVRRPLLLLGLAAALFAVILGIQRRQALAAVMFLLIAPIPLSAAYYTLRSSLLTELAGLAIGCFFLSVITPKLSPKLRSIIVVAALIAFYAVFTVSTHRLKHELVLWRTHIVEANFVEDSISTLINEHAVTEHSPPSIWTEDATVTIRRKGIPIGNAAQAYNSWLNEGRAVVPPKELIASDGAGYFVLILRTSDIADKLAVSGNWVVKRGGAIDRPLYVLFRKR